MSARTLPHFPAFAREPGFKASPVEFAFGHRRHFRVSDLHVPDIILIILHADHQAKTLSSAFYRQFQPAGHIVWFGLHGEQRLTADDV